MSYIPLLLARLHGKTPTSSLLGESLDSMIGTRSRAQAATARLAELLPVLGRLTGGGHSLVNQPYFLGGGENTSGHTCTTLLAGRNLGYVIIQITLTAKTNFRYVKNVFTLRSNFATQNKLALSHSTRSKSCLVKSRVKYAKASL